MNHVEKNDFLESSLQRQLQWIQSSDSKANAYLTLILALLVFLMGRLGSAECASRTTLTLLGIGIASLYISLILAACAKFPRTTGPSGKVIYFGHIASSTVDEFRDDIVALDEGALAEELLLQVHRNAQIARLKHQWLQRSALCLLITTPIWSSAVAMSY